MSIEKITEQDKKNIDAQILRIKQDNLITKKLTSQTEDSKPSITELMAQQKEIQINNSSGSKSDVKDVTSLQLKKAKLNEKIDLVNERLGLAASFMQKFVKFMQHNKEKHKKEADDQQIEEFMNQMSEIKNTAEKELPHFRDKIHLKKETSIGDLRFAGVLKNVYEDPNNANNAYQKLNFKKINIDKITTKSAGSKLEEEKIKTAIVQKNVEDAKEFNAKLDEIITKHESVIIKPDIKYSEEKEKIIAHDRAIIKHREKLLKVLPFLDEKKHFFEYILGDKVEEFKAKLKEKENTKKFIVKNEERSRDRVENYIQKIEKQNDEKKHGSQSIKNSQTGPELFSGADKNRVNTLKKSLIVSELSNDEKNIDELDNEVKIQYQAISSMMDSISGLPVDDNEIFNIDKMAEKTLAQIGQLRKKLEMHKQELPDDKKIEDEILDAKKPPPSIDLNRAVKLVEQIVAPAQIDKVHGVQKKMTPWVVQQLIF